MEGRPAGEFGGIWLRWGHRIILLPTTWLLLLLFLLAGPLFPGTLFRVGINIAAFLLQSIWEAEFPSFRARGCQFVVCRSEIVQRRTARRPSMRGKRRRGCERLQLCQQGLSTLQARIHIIAFDRRWPRWRWLGSINIRSVLSKLYAWAARRGR